MAWAGLSVPVLAATRADGSVGFWDSIPIGGIVLVVAGLAAAVALSLALGPLGRPRPVAGRQGGLTRALARTQPRPAAGPEAGERSP